ncbi:unnamed protein product [Lactuca saligna]|uniref:Uncharacterized protein n=1 Tax=Lactuca saligna TaxID=75948 RepID=A0AA36A458_LACSI|nr:unnamed protein product [Lactuca saligna]
MDDHGSKRKKKKKRGKSLIFKNFFKPATSGDDPSSGSGRKALASDDNLVYCDVSGNCVDPDIKKSSSSRMSRIFKAVLFDTAVKKKIHGNDSSETPNESQSSSPVRDDKIKDIGQNIQKIDDDSINVNKSDVMKIDKIEKNNGNSINEIEKNSNSNVDRSIQPPLPSKPDETPVTSSTITTGSQTLTERKVNAVDKKPPLPSNPRPPVKPIMAEESKQVASNNPPLFILVGFLVVVVVLWKIYSAITGGSSDVAIVGDEL